jgi:sec-independent protein translocase protein TatA
VNAPVAAQVERGDRGAGDRTGRVLADQREHRPVVVKIRVHVEKRITRTRRDRDDHVGSRALADVHDAFEHRSTPAEAGEPTKGTVAPVNLGAPELLIVLLVILVLFGGAKLPKLARSMGQAQSEFKRGLGETGKTKDADEDDEKTS